MNVLNEFSKQVKALFESMTPASRVMAGLMLGVIVTSLGWVFTAQQTSNYEYLFGGRDYSDSELELWEATFGEAQLRDYERVGKRIKIPIGKKDLYLKALSSANALPKEYGGYMTEAINSGGPFDSNLKTDLKMKTAKEFEVANIIRRIPGISFAAVQYDERREGFARNTFSVCSVAVQAHGNAAIRMEKLKVIADKVQSSFASLTPENITVTDLGAAQSYRGSNDFNSVEQNPYLRAQTQWQDMYMQKVAALLSNYGEIKLDVNVELDPKLLEESEKLQYDPTAVTVQTSESKKDLENQKAAPAGQPGAASNGVSNQPQSINGMAVGQSSNVKESEANERRVAGHEAIVTKVAGLVPKKVSVTVGIPDSHYRKVWAFRAARDSTDPAAEPVSPTTAELATLKTEIDGAVRSAVLGIPVGIREGDDRKPFIEIYSYTDLPLPAFVEPTLTEVAKTWLAGSWSTLALLGVVLLSLGMMFSWIKSQGGSEVDAKFADSFGLQIPDNFSDELDLEGENSVGADGVGVNGRAKPSFDLSGGEIKEDLSTLIKENPDAAVNLLKSWIGEAA